MGDTTETGWLVYLRVCLLRTADAGFSLTYESADLFGRKYYWTGLHTPSQESVADDPD